MRKITLIFAALLGFSFFASAQENDTTNGLVSERQALYQTYLDTKSSLDSVQPDLVLLRQKMEEVIAKDDQIINEHYTKVVEELAGIQNELTEAKASADKLKFDQATNQLYFLIAAGAAGLMFLLFLIFLIMMITKGGKVKKLKKELAEKDALVTESEEKIAAAKQDFDTRYENLKKEYDTLKATSDQERRTFSNKEAEYTSQVRLIEEKIKKSALKESELNYQVFQLELRIKNELEETIKSKCDLENKVTDIERQLSETRQELAAEKNKPAGNIQELQNYQSRVADLEHELNEVRQRLEEEMNKPHGDGNNDQEVQSLREKVAWYEGEAGYLRKCADDERIIKEQLENDVRNKQNLIDELSGKIQNLENRLSEGQQGPIGDGGQEVAQLQNRVADLELELREVHEEKNRLLGQIDEMLKFFDRFRQGN